MFRDRQNAKNIEWDKIADRQSYRNVVEKEGDNLLCCSP